MASTTCCRRTGTAFVSSRGRRAAAFSSSPSRPLPVSSLMSWWRDDTTVQLGLRIPSPAAAAARRSDDDERRRRMSSYHHRYALTCDRHHALLKRKDYSTVCNAAASSVRKSCISARRHGSAGADGPISVRAETDTPFKAAAAAQAAIRFMGGGPRPKGPKYPYQKKKAAAATVAARGASKQKRQQKQQKQSKQRPRRPKSNNKEQQEASAQQQQPPPAYLHPTASPHVYIASCAAIEANIDPQTLFTDTGTPPSFTHSQFEYVSPKILNHNLPNFPLPEVCFLGKSNVGKSSLINALTKSRDLARISKRPGRTQQVNYFALIKRDRCTHQGGDVYSFRPSDSTGFLIDLPGYGYAAAPDDKVSTWQANTQQFVLDRRDATWLKRMYLLIDARRGVADFDRAVMGWFDEARVPYSIVLTKADRVGRPQLVRFVNDVCMRYHSLLYGEGTGDGDGGGDDYDEEDEEGAEGAEEVYQGPVVHVTSSKTGEGIEPLMWSIDSDFVDAAAQDLIMEEEYGDR